VNAALLVLAAAVLFGTTGTAQALGPDGLDPLLVGGGRVVLGGALLAALAAVSGGLRGFSSWPRLPLLIGAAGVAGYQVCFFAGVATAGVAVGTVVTIGSAPAFTGLLAWAYGQGRPSGRWTVATLLAVAGCAVLVLGGGASRVDPVGVLLALGSGLGYAGYAVAAKRLLDEGHPPVGVMGATFGAGGLLLVPVLLLLGAAPLADPGALGVILYLAVVPTAIAYVLYARGLQHLTAATAATLTLAEPVVAAMLGVVLLHEPVTPARLVGAGLVLGGLLVVGAARRRTPAAPLPVVDPVPVGSPARPGG
jgi:DME family drug/metabolite transporter